MRVLEAALEAEIASLDAMMSTTPHLSNIRNTAAALLQLLREPNHSCAGRAPADLLVLSHAAELEALKRSVR